MKRAVRYAVKRMIARVCAAGQRLGFDILPRHFYSGIPGLRKLRRSAHWRKASTMIGLPGADPDGQLAFVRAVMTDELRRRVARGTSTAPPARATANLGPARSRTTA
jgi:hypothetical protein